MRVRPNFYMIAGAGGNIGVQIGSDGVVLVNAGIEAASGRVLAAIRKLTDLPIRYVIDTNAEADFVGGNGQTCQSRKNDFHQCTRQSGFGRGHDERRRRGDSCSRQHSADG